VYGQPRPGRASSPSANVSVAWQQVHAQRHTPDAAREVEKQLLENVLLEDPDNVMLVVPDRDDPGGVHGMRPPASSERVFSLAMGLSAERANEMIAR
jgi:hypothetical protein